ncbi:MAG: polysaccharide deacetylase family protein [Clostridia bacterium]|nr:polysaccharide deacetylase family protein [Clostridia bacterium]
MKRIVACLTALALLAGMIGWAAADEITYTGTVTGGSLHLRREPNSSAKVIQTYKSGTQVEILENDGTWCKVTVGKNTGYMMTQYLDIKPNYPHLGWGRTAADGTVLNFRVGAGTTFPIVYKAMSGCSFELVEEAGTWYRVRVKDQFGYIEKSKVTALTGDFEMGFSLNDDKDAVTAATLYSALREYGGVKSMVKSEGDFTYSLAWPETGVAEADSRLSNWVQETLRVFQEDFTLNHAGETGKCTVEFQSLNVDSRYHSVVLLAEYKVGSLKVEKVLTLNIDSQEGKVLDNRTLFPLNEARVQLCLDGAVSSLLVKPTDGYSDKLGIDCLQYAALGHDGVQIYLPAGLYLPNGLGTRKLNLRYTQTAECMTLDSQTIHSYERTIDPTRPMLALTFDDGPSDVTDRILKVLMEYDARATFYVIGNKLEEYADVLKRTAASGNEIACHTWSHVKLINVSAAKMRTQITSTNDLIKEITGGEVKLLRPPYGNQNATLRGVCKDLGIVITRWEIDTKDWSSRNTNKVYKAIMKGAGNGQIILCHDLYPTTAAAVEMAIPELIEKGYQLVTVSELLSFHKDGPVPGKVYNWVDPKNMIINQK